MKRLTLDADPRPYAERREGGEAPVPLIAGQLRLGLYPTECPTCASESQDEPGPGWIASGCSDRWHFTCLDCGGDLATTSGVPGICAEAHTRERDRAENDAAIREHFS